MQLSFLGTLLGTFFVLHYTLLLSKAETISSEESVSSGADAEPVLNMDHSNLEEKWNDKMEYFTSYLEQLLTNGDSWYMNNPPLLYIEDIPQDMSSTDEDTISTPWKRSRYYRRYPWKRQNGRHRTQYADAVRYMCNPTKEDVFQLLVALHEAREGNMRRTVNFCNRKRPASTIFTNIRFLGRRK